MSKAASFTPPRTPTFRHRAFDLLTLNNRIAEQIRWGARLWGIAAAIALLLLAVRDGIPTTPELGQWQIYAQLALLALAAIGSLITWRYEAPGASMMLLGGIGLGVLATVEYDPQMSFVAALLFVIPSVAVWFVWQRTRRMRTVIALAVTMLVVLASGGYASATMYDYVFGPTHPESATTAPDVDLVEWIWSGGATQTAITVNARLADDQDSVRLAVSTQADMQSAVYSTAGVADDDLNDRVVSFTMDDLTPATAYYYAIEADGRLDLARQGQFTTFPDGATSFQFAFSACARTGSNGQVFDAIRMADPLFYMNLGDIHYEFIDVDSPQRFRDALAEALTQPAQAALYQSVPIAYVWDDHDYGPNDGDRTSPTRDAVQQVYREDVPHYPLVGGTDSGPIYQAFTVGRVRFILTDTRSERDPATDVDNAEKSMLGDVQKAWLKQEMLSARDTAAAIVWINSGPWIDAASVGADTWGGYATERRELADFIAANGIDSLFMLSGDAHSIAIDDGTNSDFSTSGGGGFPVFHAAPLDKRGGTKGGPYSEGTSAESGQFGLVTVNDDGGDTIGVIFSGRNYLGEEVLQYEFSIDVTID